MSTPTGTSDAPLWWRRVALAFQSGAASAFILHGNVEDHIAPGVQLRSFLRSALANREVVAFYDRTGWTFPLPGSEARARQLLGMEAAAPAGGALAALTGNAAPARPPEFPAEPAAAFALLRKLLGNAEVRSAAVVFYGDLLLPASEVAATPAGDRTAITHLLEMARPDAGLPNLLILVARSLADLHPALRSTTAGFRAIEVPMPTREDRLRFIRWFTEMAGGPAFQGITPEQLANQTAGLSAIQIENILLEAMESGGVLTAAAAREAKEAMIRQEYAGLVEIMDPTFGFEAVGGMDRLKEWARREVIGPIAEGRTQDVPKGVLLVGPPGTGKTFFVKALAREIGFNAVALNMENILGGIVGESEKRLARVLALVRSLAPVLVFIDELDQSDISRRGNDSGNPVAANLFSQVLRFLGDESNRGRVIFFAATNRPDLLDPALMRFGRVDAVIPVLLPDRLERLAVAAAQAKAQGAEIEAAALQLLADGAEGYSAADLAALVAKARRLGNGRIGPAEAQRALQTIRPNSLQLAEYYTLLAVQAVNDADLLPPAYAALLSDRQQLRQQIEAQAPAPDMRRRGRTL